MLSEPAAAEEHRSSFSPSPWHNAYVGEAMDFEALANKHKDAVYRQMLRVCSTAKMRKMF
jgi:hypothetical protein